MSARKQCSYTLKKLHNNSLLDDNMSDRESVHGKVMHSIALMSQTSVCCNDTLQLARLTSASFCLLPSPPFDSASKPSKEASAASVSPSDAAVSWGRCEVLSPLLVSV